MLSLLVLIMNEVNTHLILESNKQIEEKVGKLLEQEYKNKIYWEHIGSCSFINRDSIKVGHQGYLYSTYHRKYKIK
jgi:hypothetical protein